VRPLRALACALAVSIAAVAAATPVADQSSAQSSAKPPAKADKPAAKAADTVPAAVFDDPCVDGSDAACQRRALDPLYAAFAATEAGTATAPVRIAYLGDSVTADDLITNFLRITLQARFGNGGPGFLYAAAPHEYCRHRAAKRVLTGEWNVHGIAAKPPRDKLMGLGGSTADTYDGKVKLTANSADVAVADVYYLAQPRGGSVDVVVDKVTHGTIDTAADAKSAGFQSVALPAGTRAVTLQTNGRVRLFGVALEAKTGLVVDNLGVVNATAKQFAANLAGHWEKQLAHRAPDLLVLMLGGNEAAWLPAKGEAMAEHERLFTQLVTSARAANPDRACLVVSPFDQLAWEADGTPPRASIPAIVDAQHRAATAAGCAFWDAYRWMGGKGSSRGWRKKKLLTNDFQHPTEAGSRRIADALAAGLVDGYAAWRDRGVK
jgi:lysophospholipase L1-like esterase